MFVGRSIGHYLIINFSVRMSEKQTGRVETGQSWRVLGWPLNFWPVFRSVSHLVWYGTLWSDELAFRALASGPYAYPCLYISLVSLPRCVAPGLVGCFSGATTNCLMFLCSVLIFHIAQLIGLTLAISYVRAMSRAKHFLSLSRVKGYGTGHPNALHSRFQFTFLSHSLHTFHEANPDSFSLTSWVPGSLFVLCFISIQSLCVHLTYVFALIALTLLAETAPGETTSGITQQNTALQAQFSLSLGS